MIALHYAAAGLLLQLASVAQLCTKRLKWPLDHGGNRLEATEGANDVARREANNAHGIGQLPADRNRITALHYPTEARDNQWQNKTMDGHKARSQCTVSPSGPVEKESRNGGSLKLLT